MAKNTTYILIIFFLIKLGLSVNAQGVQDSLFIKQDSIIIKDSTITFSDSIQHDSTKNKWDFKTIGGNDSTYYSFYGHLFNVDDTNIIRYWNYNKTINELDIHYYDSTLQDFHIYHPAFKKTINNSFLGNNGSAVKSNIFAEPNQEIGYIFLNSFTPYMFQSKYVDYYNVHKPFTIFKAVLGPNEEQNIEILHTQNVNRYFNAFIRYKNYTGKGSYNRQKVRDNSGVIGASYNKGRLSTHVNWCFSRIDIEENGGIADHYLITDSTISTNVITTRLKDGSNYAKSSQWFFDQKIGFFKTNVPDSAQLGAYWISLQYTFNKEKSFKEYRDVSDEYTNPITNKKMHLYENNYIGGATFDSSYYSNRNHNFRLNLEENPNGYPFVGMFLGYGMQHTDYSYTNKDSIKDNSYNNFIKNSYLEGGIYRLQGEKFKFRAVYKLFISGYRQNDMQLKGFISQKIGVGNKQIEIKGYGNTYIKTPDYFLNKYYSNHYKWNNNFSAEKRTSLNFRLSYPYLKTQLGSRFNILTDYIYFNNKALPEQYNGTFSVFDIYLNNTLSFKKLNLTTRLNYQVSGNEDILPLPKFSTYMAFYVAPNLYFKDTGGKMKLQLGVDVTYWSKYYGQAYSPALARFYNQTDEVIGNYPFVGVFANFEIKRLRFFLRFDHANYGLTKPKNYFMTPYYPTDKGTFRYGLAWTFYD